MRALSAASIVTVWETGESQHPLDRALTLLCAAEPELSRAEAALLPLGERDRRLLRARELTCGPAIEALCTCPVCDGAVMFDCRVSDLLCAPGAESGELRPPNSADLAAISDLSDPEEAMRVLAARCGAPANTAPTTATGDPKTPTENRWNAKTFGERLAALDPQSDVTLELICPTCGRGWTEPFDIAAFFWAEVSSQARRLLQDVDTLARAYGWSEYEILSLSARRRRAYLELVAS